MRVTNKRLWDQIFELKYLSKGLIQQSKKCEEEERLQKLKAKRALEKGNMEGASIHAENAIRKKNEALNYLKMSSRLDAVIARLDQQNTLTQVNKSAAGITKSINSLLSKTSVNKIQANMSDFERALQDLDVATASMDNSMSQQAAVLHNEKECNSLLQQLIDENKMDISLSAPNASNVPVAAVGNKEEEDESEDIMAMVQQLRNS